MLLLIVVLSVVAGVIVPSRLFRRWWRRTNASHAAVDCRCGYPLAGLAVPRCPECGRVVGFDATPEQLGLSLEQLQRVEEARVKRSRVQ